MLNSNRKLWPHLCPTHLFALCFLAILITSINSAELPLNFATFARVPVQGGPISLVAGDLNGDKIGDLVVSTTNRLHLLLGVGDATFRPARTFNVNTPVIGAVITDYYPPDGLDDFLYNSSGALYLVRGRTNELFDSIIRETSGYSGALCAGDFTGLGGPSIKGSSSYSDIAAGDLNNDGKDEAVMAGPTQGQWAFAVFTNSSSMKTYPASDPRSRTSVGLADFSRDGFLDILTINSSDWSVELWLNDGSGLFQITHSLPVQVRKPLTLFVKDLNQDGAADLVVRGQYSGLSVLAGKTTGGFAPAKVLASDSTGLYLGPARSIAVADFNKDSLPDIAYIDNEAIAILTQECCSPLEISQVQDLVRIQWKAAGASGAFLQSSTSLAPTAIWTTVPFSPLHVETNRVVFESFRNETRFYRLQKP